MRPSTGSDRRKSTLSPPPPTSFSERMTRRETCQPCTENQQVGLSGNLAAKRAGPEHEQGVAIIPFGWPQQQKKSLNLAPRDGGSSDYTSRELHSFLFPNLSISKSIKKAYVAGKAMENRPQRQ